MAAPPPPGMEAFDAYFRRADLDRDGRISGAEAVAFFQGANLPKPVLAQVWMHADQHKTGFLGRQEFHNALRLVTVAQSGRELTPDIVKAALFSPAAAKIPAPQINPVPSAVSQLPPTTPTPQSSNTMMSPLSQVTAGPTGSQNLGFRSPQAPSNAGANHFMRPPLTATGSPIPMQGLSQGLPGGSSLAGPRLPSSSTSGLSTDWLGNRTNIASEGVAPQIPVRGLTPVNQDVFRPAQWANAPGVTPRPQTPAVPASSTPLVQPSPRPATSDSKALVLSGNGSSSDSFFGGDMFSATGARQDASKPTLVPNSTPNPSMSSGSQNLIQPGQPAFSQTTSRLPPTGFQSQGTQFLVKQNQLDIAQNTSQLNVSSVSVGSVSPSGQTELPWPKMTQSNIQKYTAVFLEVDKDRDGKITGLEARNLFLSWRLPREVLKQVWDLSDQDNDSMLSLREFCTALYLMERYREGRPLPAVLPNSLRFDEALLLATSQPSTANTGPAWQPSPGLPQQGMPGSQHAMPPTRMKPPLPAPLPSKTDDTVQPAQQKSKVPVLEKHLVNQLSKEEQSALNSKFQEASDADKKVQELEKEILESREKIEFYRTKMQEIVLYKSKCDSRLNEVMERTSADKREVESLAKKYEAKYKESGDVASKLTLDQATFRDIQEKKLELFNAIVKIEKGGDADESLQVRADQIKSELDDLVKSLNERCKQYGLRAKPTTLVELPFGWQPGIQEGAADWDKDWDKLEEDGFTVIKELTIEVEDVVAPEKPNPSSVESDRTSKDKESSTASSNVDGNIEKPSEDASSSAVDSKTDKATSNGEQVESETQAHSEDESARSPPGSPGRPALESSSQDIQSSEPATHDVSPRAKESHSEHGGAESATAERSTDEPLWGANFDSHDDDDDSVWGFSTLNGKENDKERRDENFFFGSGDFGLNPIRTAGSPSATSASGNERKGPFFDSVPSTPLFNSDSPMFNERPEERSFDSFSRFDSFSMNDGVFPQRDTFARFDSMRGAKLSRFDSISSTTDHSRGLSRFDSISSTTDHSRGFPSFDDSDPFGSSEPFKSSESHTPKKGTDSWSAF